MKKLVFLFISLALCAIASSQTITFNSMGDENYLRQDSVKEHKIKTAIVSTKMSLFINLNIESYISEKTTYDTLGRISFTQSYDMDKNPDGEMYYVYGTNGKLALDSNVADSGKGEARKLYRSAAHFYEYDSKGNLTAKKTVYEKDTFVYRYTYAGDTVTLNYTSAKTKKNNYKEIIIINKFGQDSVQFRYTSKKKKYMNKKWFYNEKKLLEQVSQYDNKGTRSSFTIIKYDKQGFTEFTENNIGNDTFVIYKKYTYEYYK